MTNYKLVVSGLHHYFLNSNKETDHEALQRFYHEAIGKTLILRPDGHCYRDINAVAAFVGPKMVGHVAWDNRLIAWQALEGDGVHRLELTIDGYNATDHQLYAHGEAHQLSTHDHIQENNFHQLDAFHWKGPKLNSFTEELELANSGELLEELLLSEQPWDEQAQELLANYLQHTVIALSAEEQRRRTRLIQLMRSYTPADLTHQADELEHMNRNAGCAAYRHKMCRFYFDELLNSSEVRLLLEEGEDMDDAMLQKNFQQLPLYLEANLKDGADVFLQVLLYAGAWNEKVREIMSAVLYALCKGWVDLRLPKDQTAGEVCPSSLDTPAAHGVLRVAQQHGWLDLHLQPLISIPKAAILASVIAEVLKLKPRWAPFEQLWNTSGLASKLVRAQESLYYADTFQDMKTALAEPDNS